MGAVYQSYHDRLFNARGIGPDGARAALSAPVPSQAQYPDGAAQEYAAISLNVLNKYFRDPRLRGRNDDSLVSASLRFLELERIFEARSLPMPIGMPEMLVRVKSTPSVLARRP